MILGSSCMLKPDSEPGSQSQPESETMPQSEPEFDFARDVPYAASSKRAPYSANISKRDCFMCGIPRP